MTKERTEKMDLEIAVLISRLESVLGQKISNNDDLRWIIRVAFLEGNRYGLEEARIVIQDS